MIQTSDMTIAKNVSLRIDGRNVRLRVVFVVDALDRRPAGRRYRRIESAQVLDHGHPLHGLNAYPVLMPEDQERLRRKILAKEPK